MTVFAPAERAPAPDFELLDQHGSPVRLSALRGKPVVIYFFPKAFTPVCTKQTVCFQENLADLNAEGATVLGISTDDVETQKRFAEQYGVTFPMLADPDKVAVQAFGLTRGLLPMTKRVTFVIDAEGRIAARFHHELRYRKHIDSALAALRGE